MSCSGTSAFRLRDRGCDKRRKLKEKITYEKDKPEGSE